MTVQDIIDYGAEHFEVVISDEDAWKLYSHGISYCEDGETQDGDATTLCAKCRYFKECEAMADFYQYYEE